MFGEFSTNNSSLGTIVVFGEEMESGAIERGQREGGGEIDIDRA